MLGDQRLGHRKHRLSPVVAATMFPAHPGDSFSFTSLDLGTWSR
jgi:hypothetical protein